MKKYTIFVGGLEINDFYLSKKQADDLAAEYISQGYDDVFIMEA